MPKQITLGADTRAKLLSGVRKLAEPVIVTLGPKGQSVVIDYKYTIKSVDDGAQVARSILLEDPLENMGAQILKMATLQTNNIAGDGTTTSTLLAYKMAEEGFKAIENGANAVFLKKGMHLAGEAIKLELDKLKTEVKTVAELIQVATVSCNDPELGKAIAEAIDKVGDNGRVNIKENSKSKIEVEYVEGMEIDAGMLSPYFVTNPDRMECEIKDPVFLITDMKIGGWDEMGAFIKNFGENHKNIVIIADEVDGDALEGLVVNLSHVTTNGRKGTLNIAAVKIPGYGERKRGMLEDLAILTGGTLVSSDLGIKLGDVTEEMLGHAEMFWANKDASRIINGAGTKENIEKRVKYLRLKAAEEEAEFDKDKTYERAARLDAGVAIIKIGMATEIETKDKIEKAKDAEGATWAAKEEGIVPGGGVAYLRASEVLKNLSIKETDKNIIIGMQIVFDALQWPLKQVLLNSGESERIIVKVEEGTGNFGFDVMDRSFGDLIEKGIIDAVKVEKVALENAVSVVGELLRTAVLIADLPEPSTNNP